MRKFGKVFSLLLCGVLVLVLAACSGSASGSSTTQSFEPLDYADASRWVSRPSDTTKAADTFFLLPVVNLKSTEPGNSNIDDEREASRYVKTFNMESGIVSESTNVFAPYYRQATLGCYINDNGMAVASPTAVENNEYVQKAYEDVRNAFSYYLKNLNGGRPIVLFGYSQGANMVLRLLDEFGDELTANKQLVVAYAIGMSFDEEFLARHPAIRMAQGEDDTGVVVCYNAVDERWLQSDDAASVTSKEMAINPLNWKTDSTKADGDANLGYVTVNTTGEVTDEQVGFCGAYLDDKTGKLVVTNMQDGGALYDADSNAFAKGDYHLYDLSLFYRNLQKNVATRLQ